MPECEKCPIREECEEEREDIVSRAPADMRAFVHGASDYCPLLEYLYVSFKRNIDGIEITDGLGGLE